VNVHTAGSLGALHHIKWMCYQLLPKQGAHSNPLQTTRRQARIALRLQENSRPQFQSILSGPRHLQQDTCQNLGLGPQRSVDPHKACCSGKSSYSPHTARIKNTSQAHLVASQAMTVFADGKLRVIDTPFDSITRTAFGRHDVHASGGGLSPDPNMLNKRQGKTQGGSQRLHPSTRTALQWSDL
jgi:hypothetical protein